MQRDVGMRIVFTWAWLFYALKRLFRGRLPALRAKIEPSLSGGPPTPWAAISRPMIFGGAVDRDAACNEPVVEFVVAQPRPVVTVWHRAEDDDHTRLQPVAAAVSTPERSSWSYIRRDVAPARGRLLRIFNRGFACVGSTGDAHVDT